MQNSSLIRLIEKYFWVKKEDFTPGQADPQRSTTTAYFTAWASSSFDDSMGDFNEKIE